MIHAAERVPDLMFDDGSSVFRGYVPARQLRHAVALIWTTSGRGSRAVERVLPNGVVELIINLGRPQRVVHGDGSFARHHAAWVAGVQQGLLDIASEADSDLVGVRFRPGGAAPFLGLPADSVVDSVVEANGGELSFTVELRERLLEAGSAGARAGLAERWLLRRLSASRGVDRRVAVALRALQNHPAGLAVGALAAELGVSHKHLVHLFKREVGVGPKSLQRILRFQTVLQACESSRGPHWTTIAQQCGYADQAHLNHDFRALSGVTPSAYWAARTVDPNHLSIEPRLER